MHPTICRDAQRRPERPREAQRGPERPREAQRGPERPREARRGPERPREAQRGPEKPREAQRGPGRPRKAQKGPERPREAQNIRTNECRPGQTLDMQWEQLSRSSLHNNIIGGTICRRRFHSEPTRARIPKGFAPATVYLLCGYVEQACHALGWLVGWLAGWLAGWLVGWLEAGRSQKEPGGAQSLHRHIWLDGDTVVLFQLCCVIE